MKILYLAAPGDASTIGGIQRYERDVGEAMALRGHDARWLHCRPADALSQLALRDRIPMPRYWAPFYFRRRIYLEDYRFYQHTAREVAKACEGFTPDLIHSFHLYNAGAIGACRCPVSVTCHGLEVQELPPVVRMLQTASGVHAVSAYTANLARRIGSVEPRVLSWGVRPSAQVSTVEDYDLITVSRLVHRKNVDTVLRALVRLPALRYVVVGDGPERPELQRLAQSLRLANVDFVGAVSDEELHGLYARSRLFVMVPRASAEDFEGLGLVYYEAHGHGLPVLASSNGGISEAVGDGGILLDGPEDPDVVARAIESALQPERLAELKTRVTTRQRTHSWTRFVDAFEKWHSEVAGQAS